MVANSPKALHRNLNQDLRAFMHPLNKMKMTNKNEKRIATIIFVIRPIEFKLVAAEDSPRGPDQVNCLI